MKMKIKIKMRAARLDRILSLCLSLLLLAVCVGCVREDVRVERDESRLAVRFDGLSSTVSETYTLNEGDSIDVAVPHCEGEARISITSGNGETVYTGRTPLPESFRVSIGEDGEYTLSVSGEDACGEVVFSIRRASE